MSKVNEHHVIAVRHRYSGGGGQHDMSNETQEAGIMKFLAANGHRPYIALTLQHKHSAYDPDSYRLEEDFKKIARYNRNNPNPITLLLHHDWSRWMRNSDESNHWKYKFNKIRVEVNVAYNWIDFSDANAKLFFQFEQHQHEQYSAKLGRDIVKANTGWKERGYFPHNTPRRYLIHVDKGTPERRNVWTPAADNLRRAIQLLGAGSTIVHAYHQTGGKDVHGHINTFSENVRKEVFMSRREGQTFAFAPIVDEVTWQAAQDHLKDNRVFTKLEKSIMDAWLSGVIISDPCNKRVSRSTVKKNGKPKAKYYICPCKDVRHYRVRRSLPEQDAIELLKSIGLSAQRQQLLSKKAEARSQKQLRYLKQDQKRQAKELAEAQELVKKAKRKFVLDQITMQDQQEYINEMNAAKARLLETEQQIENYGQILERVKASIANIGTFLSEYDNKLQIRDFLMVLFPDGLKYDANKRMFRTTSINAAYCIIDKESVTCSKIKFGVAIQDMTTPALGRKLVPVRTPQSDLALLTAYLEKYNVA